MKLAFCLLHYFPFGGLQKDFIEILAACLKRGHLIDVYTLKWEGPVPSSVKLHCLPACGLTNHARAWHFSQDLHNFIYKNKKRLYDGVIGFNKMSGLDIYFAADHCFAKGLSCFKKKLPRYFMFAKLEGAVFADKKKGGAAKIIVLNPAQQKDFQAVYKTEKDRFFLLPPSLEPVFIEKINACLTQRQDVRAALGLSTESLMLLMMGSDFKRKGLDRALTALAGLKNKDAYFFIVGDDNPRPYERQIKKYGLASQVHFLGAQENVASFYAAADIFLHLAYREAAGKVILEALAAGLPVLVTDVCGYSFHVEACGAGEVLKSPYDHKACQKALLNIVQRLPQHREVLFRKARAYIHAQLHASVGETLATLIEEKPWH